MSGIVAYKGNNKCLPFLLDGLKRLEHKGYDSVGVSYIIGNELFTQKQTGSIIDLINNKIDLDVESYTGIGHIRWASHGQPCYRNCHPQTTLDERLAIVHNGIIENHSSLRSELQAKGFLFRSETDTEVLLDLIYDYLLFESQSLYEAVKLACERIEGAYAFAVIDKKLNNRHKLVLSRKGSPLVVGLGKDAKEFFVASDAGVFDERVDKIIYLEDNVVGEIDQKCKLYSLNHKRISSCNIQKLHHQIFDIEKGDFEHFMLKEIYEQPHCVDQCLSGRLDGYRIKLGGLNDYKDKFSEASHLTIVGCGSSYYSGLLGKYYIEELCGIKVSVEHASEFRYRSLAIKPGDIVLGISQSGETCDTVGALEIAKSKGAFVLGICNSPNSQMTRLTTCGIFLKSGRQIGVASTKVFSNQIVSLLLLSLWIEQNRRYKIVSEYRQQLVNSLMDLPNLIEKALDVAKEVRLLAYKLHKNNNFLYLGRGYNYPIALDGALKLKEISYIHAEGCLLEEVNHGTCALIDKNMPVMIVANHKRYIDKITNTIKQIQDYDGQIISICADDNTIDSDYNISVPKTMDILAPILGNIPLQLFSYYCGLFRKCDIDKPRNLVKNVTEK